MTLKPLSFFLNNIILNINTSFEKNLRIISRIIYLHTLDAAVPITESTTRVVKILTAISDSPNNLWKNVVAMVSSILLFNTDSARITEKNAIFTRRSVKEIELIYKLL